MTLRIYNTLTRTKEEFKPLDPKNVRIYVCGPTVYDFAHIGNARPAIVFDVMFRLLRHLYGPAHVTYVRNITDVDDKINARALRDFPGVELNDAIRRVTETTYNQYQKDTTALGCLPPTHQPRATEHIAGIVEMIQVLLDKGIAYVAQGEEGREALFDILMMPDYGKLAGRKQEDQKAGARVAVEKHKRNPGDFVLWKESNTTEPGWDATFQLKSTNQNDLRLNSPLISIFGRPGWHIECSVMSKHHLGEVFDIHGGGLDLIFPHHENEIAQSRCAHGSLVMANYWMHNGFLQVEGKKMSKSLGNFFAIDELLNQTKFGGRKWSGQLLRLAMLMTHYREPIDFSLRKLEEAENILALLKLDKTADLRVEDRSLFGSVGETFSDAIFDDLNTPQAIRSIQVAARTGQLSNIAAMADLLGLIHEHEIVTQVNDTVVNGLISGRLAARKSKDWKRSDEIRDELLGMGIQIKDSKDPVTGELKTAWEVKR